MIDFLYTLAIAGTALLICFATIGAAALLGHWLSKLDR